jgi:RHS repeat-associated protein
MVDASGTNAFSYTQTSQLRSETGPWGNDTVAYGYTQGLRTELSVNSQPSAFGVTYGYDPAFRLQTLAATAGNFGYSYAGPASPLVSGITLPNFASITNHYDPLARLDFTALVNRWGGLLDATGYQHDPLGLRTNVTRYLGVTTNTVAVGYDSIGQITSWSADNWADGLRQNEQFGFGFDKAGNLISRTNGGLVQSFICDPVNELTNITRNGVMTVSGALPGLATSVTVNGSNAQQYGDFTFAATNQSLANGQNNFTIVARKPNGTKVTNSVVVNLPTNVTLQYDLNGNLTNDGTRSFAYSAENQLTNLFVVGGWQSVFIYDGLGRRRISRDYTWNGGWVLTNEVHYVYDGMLPVQELDTNSNVLVTYTRGLDLSSSRAGAGGIGGLLARTDGNGSTFYHTDGAGNITSLIDGNQNMAARYLYSAFGRLIGQSGPIAGVNEMQFSSMPFHRQSGLSLYAFRGYDPTSQRWLNRDPVGEAGGMNLYGFVGNNPIGEIDPYGFDSFVPGVNGSRENSVPALSLTGSGGKVLSTSYPGPDAFVGGILAVGSGGVVAAEVGGWPELPLFSAAAILDRIFPSQMPPGTIMGAMPWWMGGPKGKCPPSPLRAAGPMTKIISGAGEAVMTVENGVARIGVGFVDSQSMLGLIRQGLAQAQAAGASSVVVDTGYIIDRGLADSLAARAQSGQGLLGGTITSTGTASLPRFSITIPVK